MANELRTEVEQVKQQEDVKRARLIMFRSQAATRDERNNL
jgi:hypothetical protein